MRMKDRTGHKHRFLKEVVVGFGFLSGLWIHLGVDPQSIVFYWLQQLLLHFEPQYGQMITILFFVLPIVMAVVGWLGAYRRAGLWGVAAVGLAFYAGILLGWYSIPLLLIAIAIGFLAARR